MSNKIDDKKRINIPVIHLQYIYIYIYRYTLSVIIFKEKILNIWQNQKN